VTADDLEGKHAEFTTPPGVARLIVEADKVVNF
jgi:hypothetical protein